MPQTIVDLLRRRAEESGAVRAYRFLRDETSEDVRTWVELDRRARAIGVMLRAMGAAGTNVLMLYPPGIDFIDGYFGCLYAGATPVPAYPPEPARLARTLPRVQSIVADAGARFALTTKPLLALAEMVFAQAPDLRSLQWLATDGIDIATGDQWERPAITAETFAMLQYTSGSTGTPKGVMLSHANLLANAQCVYSAFEFTPEDKILSWLPVFHDMGFMSGVLQPLYSGCPVVGLSPLAFLEKPYRWLAAISANRITVSGGPNFAYDLCVRKSTPEQRAALDLSCWKLAYNGAETIRPETLDSFVATFGPVGFARSTFFPCYGLAEATLIVSGSERAAPPVSHSFDPALIEEGVARPAPGRTLVASGRAVEGQTIAIVDGDHRAAPDRIGEIWVSGASVGHGYWQRAEDSARTFVNKLAGDEHTYVRTGDLGFLFEDQLYVCGRTKDLIIIRGANHYPQDLELTVERTHPAIRPGCIAAFAIDVEGEERVVIVAEVDRRYHDRDRRRGGDRGDRRSGDPSRREPSPQAAARPEVEPLDVDQLFWAIRDAIATTHELEPHAVVLVRAGSIQKTSSGKLQRNACKAAFVAGELEVLADLRSDGTKRHSDVATAPKPRTPTPLAVPVVAAPVEILSLRDPRVLVVGAHAEAMVKTLAEHQITATAGDHATARTEKYSVLVSDDLGLLAELALAKPQSARLFVTAFEEPEAIRDALANGRVTGVVPASAGAQQLLAVVNEALEAWVASSTDQAIIAIESWLAAWLAKRLGLNVNAIDLDAPVNGFGLDSLTVVEIQSSLSEWLGHEVPETLMRGRSSIRSIARRLTSIDVTRRIAKPKQDDPAIAIVGMGCAVPGARDVGELWALIRDNVDAIAQVPEDRLRDTGKTRWGGAVEVHEFDTAFFGIAPRDAAHIDPQHRLLLETTWQALEEGGLNPQQLAGSDTGVFIGISGSDFLRAQDEVLITDRTSAAAQRISYFLNLKGPSLTVDAGDASSLAALHTAVASLQRGECKLAIVAGVNLVLTRDMPGAYGKAGLLSADGRCKPLDARADGTVLADGCGVIVLERAAEATANHHRIHAQVLATALRQNGRGHGLTAPNEAAQEQVILEAVRAANVQTRDIGYAELNARGVAAFDAIEVRALINVLGSDRAEPCAVGSIKANIGDARAASGIIGIIKTVLALEHDELPRLLHLEAPNPDLDLGTSLRAPIEPAAWPEAARRIALVNSFGLLGTNSCVVLARETAEPDRPASAAANVLCLSARSEKALRALAGRYIDTLGEKLDDICYTANLGRAHFAQRAAIVATNAAQLRDQLAALARGELQSKRALGRGAGRIAFLFAGRDATGTARELYDREPRFRAVLQRADGVTKRLLACSLVHGLDEGPLDPSLAAPALIAIEVALAELWQSWGVYPDFVMGRDLGEYAAAVIAGAMSLEDALALAIDPGAKLQIRAASIPLISTLTGKRYAAALDAAYWRRHATEPLQPDRALKELGREGADLVVEITPGTDRAALLATLGSLYERGISPNWASFYHGQNRVRVTIPSYPFERHRCWLDP